MNKKLESAEEFDERFDSGADMTPHLDLSTRKRGMPDRNQTKRINVDIPGWMLLRLDQEAERLGITRQSVVKTWLSTMIDNIDRDRLTQSEVRKRA